ncbi:MAG: DUF4931 domain-containing protein [Planctomycetes bacterium]|jgi:UDPglucose--hexose-1-phosphate uridylyltransferase|nr:DUF4931 domain-containing protein [Planctomycetota bacterium]
MSIKSEIRKSYFFNKYVIITPNRSKRPKDIKEETVIKEGYCPFCDKNIKKLITDKIVVKNKVSTFSVENLFPAVTLNNKKAYGYQEVIVDTTEHGKNFSSLSVEQIYNILEMYVKRTKQIVKNKKINYVLCFKNQGSKAGASLCHAHSQVFATQITPESLKEEAKGLKEYKEKNKTCGYCDIIKKELSSARAIFEDKHIAAFAPYASEYHYEAWIFPKRHLDNITLLNKEELYSLAKVLKKITEKLGKLGLSFNFFLDNVVSDLDQHLYIKIQPRDSVWAGVELGSGLIINSISPEEAARYYRKK